MPVFDSNIIVNGGYVDIQQGELRSARVQNLTTAPASPVAGQVYYNTVSNTFQVYNGTTWITWYPSTTTLDQIAAPVAAVNLNSQKITNLATPTNSTDAVNKAYADNISTAISWKNAVLAASTANVNVSSPGTTLDGYTMVSGDRILLKNQTTASQNGIYQFNGSTSALTRTSDASTGSELVGAAVFTIEGTANVGTGWVCTTQPPITIGTTSITFVQFNGGATYTAGSGLALSGNTFSVVTDGTTVTVNGSNQLSVVSGAFPKKYTGTITGNASTTVFTVTHSLNTSDVVSAVRATSGTYANQYVVVDTAYSSANAVTLTFSTAPASGATFNVTCIG